MTDDRPRLAGFMLPRISSVVWITVIASVLSYFFYNRAVANLVAIIGGIIVTVVVVVTERTK